MNISIKSSNEICIATDAGLKSDTILEEVKIENFNKKNMINVCGDEMAMSTLSVIPSHDLNSRDSRELDEGLQFVESLNESPFSKKCGELKDELCNILADNPTLGISFVRSTTVENGNVVFEFKLNFFQELRDLLNDSDVETLSSFIDKNLSPELKNERVQKLRNIFKRNGVKCYCIEKNDKRCMSFMGDNTFFKNLILRDDTSLESFKKIFSDTYEKSFEDYCNDTKNLSKILDHSLDRLNVCMNYVCAHVWKDKNCPRIYRTLSADNTVVRVFFRENPQIQVSNMVKICCSKWKDAPENNFGVDNIGYITYEGIFNGFRIKAETLYKQGILAEDKKNRLIRYF
ncbi:MAG: hypothetical protein K2L13_03195, partial [Opitutales bacterium]|nr:hypothetical protein [Opitutales bacterium]